MKPLVSIIIPCYQAEKTLKRTLDDLCAQDYTPIELIAVDDGSTDDTSAILQTYGTSVRMIRQKNAGAPAARNHGFRQSRGAYVFFCDADVRSVPYMISRLVQTLESHSEAAYAYCNFKFGIHTFDLFPFNPERLRRENYISTMSLIRRQDFIGFDESLTRYQDWDLWKRMLDQGKRGVWCNERLFRAPLRLNGISRFSMRSFYRIVTRRLSGHR